MTQVSDHELKQFVKLIYDQAGIFVSPQKKTLLSNRLRRRLRQTGIESFGKYLKNLTRLQPNDPEWDAFLQEITTHETYLFRDDSQWNWFCKTYLPERIANKNARRSLKIWSAACSTGDEAYTIAACIANTIPEYEQWQISIIGTDIGVGSLKEAKAGVFGERAMRLAPKLYRLRYFTKSKDAEVWQAKPELKAMTSFRQHNLIHPLNDRNFDVVFLKNVLIYFNTESKKRVLDRVRSVIKPGGLLVTGAAEGVADLVRDFKRIHPWLHQMPKKNGGGER